MYESLMEDNRRGIVRKGSISCIALREKSFANPLRTLRLMGATSKVNRKERKELYEPDYEMQTAIVLIFLL